MRHAIWSAYGSGCEISGKCFIPFFFSKSDFGIYSRNGENALTHLLPDCRRVTNKSSSQPQIPNFGKMKMANAREVAQHEAKLR